MKIKILYALMVLGTLAMLNLFLTKSASEVQSSSNSQELKLKVSSNKKDFVKGEAVELSIDLINEANQSIKIGLAPTVENGFLHIWIAESNQELKEYRAENWGLRETGKKVLQAGQSFNSQATILWNSKPEVSGLNEDAAKRAMKGKISTDYAFPNAGVYSIKAVATIKGEVQTKIESEPIQIVISEPVGDDLKIWNQIKGNQKIARLMQTGEFNTSKSEEVEQLIVEVEQILENYPNSVYSRNLRTNLEKYRANEERRIEFMKKSRQP